jgi:hypothetical protein
MLHIVAFRPGDELVSVNSSSPEVAAHAVKLINKGPYAPAEVKVEVSGGNYATHGARFDYGQEAFKAGSGVAKTAFASGGNSFSVTVLPYTITDIVLAKAQ